MVVDLCDGTKDPCDEGGSACLLSLPVLRSTRTEKRLHGSLCNSYSFGVAGT